MEANPERNPISAKHEKTKNKNKNKKTQNKTKKQLSFTPKFHSFNE